MDQTNFSQKAEDFRRIEKAIQHLESNFRDQPSLDEIAAGIHLSKYHFQRLFKRWAGISPIQFLHYLTLDYTKQKLAESRSILDASLDAGLSGPGRLHDLFVTFEAMTPGEYKRLGQGVTIQYGFHDTPFGRCLLATTPKGICALRFLAGPQSAGPQSAEPQSAGPESETVAGETDGLTESASLFRSAFMKRTEEGADGLTRRGVWSIDVADDP